MSSEPLVSGGDFDCVDTLTRLRVKLINSIYYATLPFCAVMLISGILQEIGGEDSTWLICLYIGGYVMLLVACFVRKLSYSLRAGAFLFALYIIAASELWAFGLTSITAMFLFAFVVFAGLLFNLEVGLGAFAVAGVTLGGAAAMYLSGIWASDDSHSPFYESLMIWVTSGLCFLMLSCTALILGAVLLRSLDRNMRQERKLIRSLSEEIERRNRAEEELSRNEERFRSLIENVSDAVVLADAAGVMRYASPGVERVLGFDPFKNIGRRLVELVHPEDADEARTAFSRILDGQPGFSLSVECRLLHTDGSWRTIEAVGRRYDDAQTGKCAVINYRDITERKLAAENHARLEEQLRQAQKMEATGRLAGGIAHDFNNLLQVILGHLDLMRGEHGQVNFTASEFEEVYRAAERAAELTSQLLAFSRRQIVQPVNLNLNELIQDVFNMIGRVLGEHIDARFIASPQLGTVCVDRGQFEQVLMNLCMNAAQAMPKGGRLLVETANVTMDDEFCTHNPWAAPGSYVLMSITDTGCGMSPEVMARVFEPFFTTKEAGRGTGLGLATVYGIVRQHNGLIHVDSQPGEGSVFSVYIPLVQQPADQPQPRMNPAMVGGCETVLVAEDEPMVLKLICQILSRAGYRVLSAKDGLEAVDLFAQHSSQIDLVVLDVMMPRLGGRDAMERIQAIRPDVPFLFSSGYSESAIHVDFVMKEGLRLVKKPYGRADLLQHVRSVLDNPNSPLTA